MVGMPVDGVDRVGALAGALASRNILLEDDAEALVARLHVTTRGLDIPSMELVYTKLLERKVKGMATLLISEDLDELLLLCDRIAVLYRGEVVGVLNRDKFEKYELGRMMSGVKTVA